MELAEQIDDSTFCTMYDEAATRVMGTSNSSPDITIAGGGLINSITWRPMLTLASNYLPIIISIEKPPDFVSVDIRTFINFNKANWVGFTEFTESTFNALPIPTDVVVGKRRFGKVIAAATARFIPAGRIAEIRPNFPAEVAVLANERDTLSHADPADPRIRDLNLEIRRLVNYHKRPKWIDHLKSSCNLSIGVSKLWATVKALSNPKRHDDRVEVQFNQIARGLNQKPPCERTILVSLDLSKAFDTVNHSTLLEDIEKTTLPPGLKWWTMNYLNGRQSSVLFRGVKSKLRRIKQGVPQGGVLSPLLFNFYISKLPQPPEGVSIPSYADDSTILISGNGIDGMCSKVNNFLADLPRFLTARNLTLSPTKSTATIFTKWTKEYRLELKIAVDGVKIPTVNNPQILGVTFDSLCSFSPHTTAIIAKVQSRNKILKSLVVGNLQGNLPAGPQLRRTNMVA
ncbi:uncharacterized protein LOC125779552 [Bactrocera dorsalis]|uniref:Uncharacterized protein LOC125779552 n=1 Tax=Bactrocera dorsalis TaxID=27457 RepID=A0ABM3K5W2_BACDO|nr:uncharacterized protein LOC125779552 [Bactrocera dorsalis]